MEDDSTYHDVYIVVPAKDEERYIDILIDKLEALGFVNIVIINDNSQDQTAVIARQRENVVVLDHSINLGAGAATQTGIAYAVSNEAKIIVTIDADLQHNPDDLIKLIEALKKDNCDLVIGSRFIQKNEIPKSRIFFNKIANVISWLLTGTYLTDSQSGLKAFNNTLAKHLNLNYDGFEFCMEIIKEAKANKLKIKEIPVFVSYTPETLKKGQGLWVGIKIISRLMSPFS